MLKFNGRFTENSSFRISMPKNLNYKRKIHVNIKILLRPHSKGKVNKFIVLINYKVQHSNLKL